MEQNNFNKLVPEIKKVKWRLQKAKKLQLLLGAIAMKNATDSKKLSGNDLRKMMNNLSKDKKQGQMDVDSYLFPFEL